MCLKQEEMELPPSEGKLKDIPKTEEGDSFPNLPLYPHNNCNTKGGRGVDKEDGQTIERGMGLEREEEMELLLSKGKLEDISKPKEGDGSSNPSFSIPTTIATPKEEEKAWTRKTAKQQTTGWASMWRWRYSTWQ